MEFALSLEVARKDGEVVHLALPSGSKVSDLRHVLAARLNKPGVDFVFSFNGYGGRCGCGCAHEGRADTYARVCVRVRVR